MVEQALILIERNKREGLVTNQPVNLDAIERYAIKKKAWHLLKVVRSGKIYFDAHTDLQTIVTYKNAVILLDEVGVFANARDWKELKNKAPHFLLHLLQSRKIGVDLIWAAQTHEMADPFLRSITNFFIHCDFYKPIDFYTRSWFAGERDYESWLRTRKSFKFRCKFEFGFLNYDVADCYNTNVRLEDQNFGGNDVPSVVRQIEGYDAYQRDYYLCGEKVQETVQVWTPTGKEKTNLSLFEMVLDVLPVKLPRRNVRASFQAAGAGVRRVAPKVIHGYPSGVGVGISMFPAEGQRRKVALMRGAGRKV